MKVSRDLRKGTAMSRRSKTVHNEQLKLAATAFNNLGVAVIVTGIIVPVVALAYQTALPKTRYWAAFAVLWSLVGAVLHLIARRVIERLEE
jgi:methylmalonyl-CoA mutase cobalamin-binding subunit